jgi:cell division protein FtsB
MRIAIAVFVLMFVPALIFAIVTMFDGTIDLSSRRSRKVTKLKMDVNSLSSNKEQLEQEIALLEKKRELLRVENTAYEYGLAWVNDEKDNNGTQE